MQREESVKIHRHLHPGRMEGRREGRKEEEEKEQTVKSLRLPASRERHLFILCNTPSKSWGGLTIGISPSSHTSHHRLLATNSSELLKHLFTESFQLILCHSLFQMTTEQAYFFYFGSTTASILI